MHEKFAAYLNEMSEKYDYIVINSPNAEQVQMLMRLPGFATVVLSYAQEAVWTMRCCVA